MKSRGVRVLLFLVAVAAMAAGGAGVWHFEQRIASARSAADTFEREARQAVIGLADLRAAQQAYVADGQPAEAWMTKATGIADGIGPRLSALRTAAGTSEAQGAIESSIESFTALMQTDAKAREFVKSGQRLSASDVIFTEAASTLERVIGGIDAARGQEGVARAVGIEGFQRWELMALGAAAAFALLMTLLLVPLGRAEGAEAGGEAVEAPARSRGLNLSHDLGNGVVRRAQPIPEASPAPAASVDDILGPIDFGFEPRVGPKAGAGAPGSNRLRQGYGESAGASARAEDPGLHQASAAELTAVADLCSSLARVQDTRELQGLLERTAKALDATGVIIWMPDGPQGTLRPVLAHGYAPLALSRMGIIHPAADNATATAYRTKSVVVVPAEEHASGAVVAPLITADGCSGTMAIELREGVEATPHLRALATIVAAQLATLLMPGSSPAGAPTQAPAPPASGGGRKA